MAQDQSDGRRYRREHRVDQAWIKEASGPKADLVAFPELAITGYPPEDLLFKARFVDDAARAEGVDRGCPWSGGGGVGYVGRDGTGDSLSKCVATTPAVGRHGLYNSAAVLAERRIVANYCKRHLPNYGVFDESRYFHPGTRLPLLILNGTTIWDQYLRRHLVS